MNATMDEPHPDLPTFFDPSTCVRKGLCPVTKLRGQSQSVESHSLYFEQHGTGPEKVVFIMGLNSSSFSWSDQVKHFARTGEHSVLVFDNRGVGNSDVPRGPYTTRGMAEDIIALLKYIEWNDDIHVVGISLGGMVAQELATLIPDRIVSLVLCVTKAGGLSWNGLTPVSTCLSVAFTTLVISVNIPVEGRFDTGQVCESLSRKHLNSTLFRLMTITDVNVKIPKILHMLFPTGWLADKNPDDPDGRTNFEVHSEVYKRRIEITRPQTLLGAVSQMSAAMTHRVTPDRLRSISSTIPKVLIVTGDDDNLVKPGNSKDLAACMPEAELVIWESTGHGLHAQWPKRFNALLERTFKEGREHFGHRK